MLRAYFSGRSAGGYPQESSTSAAALVMRDPPTPSGSATGETVWRTASFIALTVGIGSTLAPSTVLRTFGVSDDQKTGVTVLAWRLFGIRTAAISAAALRGDSTARRAILPIQIIDQAVMLGAWRTKTISAGTAGLGLAVSVVLSVLSAFAAIADHSDPIAVGKQPDC